MVGIKTPVRRESLASRWLHIAPLILAGWLLGERRHVIPLLSDQFLPRTELSYWLAVAITAAGLLFAAWARVHIGRNWSGTVTVKQDHELITSGPYRFVRHPIYTGILLAFAGTGLIVAEWRAVLAFAIAFAALWRKLKLEERWLTELFGSSYAAYRGRSWALIPWVL
jgi:protein-S-isoprenylcysteine O-methyltransferase Ste14